MAVLMELSRIFIREMADLQIIELCEIGGERTCSICIGLSEAFAIERSLKGCETPRPLTHDLLATSIRELGGVLKEVVVTDLSENTYFAELVIEQEGKEVTIDARPSDAIALGVAEQVPIYIAEHVLVKSQADAAEMDDEFEVGDDFELDWD